MIGIFPQYFQNISLKVFLKMGWLQKAVYFHWKQLTPVVIGYFFIHTVLYCSTSPMSNFLSHYLMNILKLLTCIYSSPMGLCIPVDSYQASVSWKYNTKMHVLLLPTNRNVFLQAPFLPPSPFAKCVDTCNWWGRRGTSSWGLLRLWHHGQVRGA